MHMPSPKAQDRLASIIKDVRGRTFPYVPKEKKRIDWASYDEAQLNEMNDYLVLVREIVDDIHREIGDIDQGKVGHPPASCFDLAKAVLVQQYFECSNRVAAGLMKLFTEKLRLRGGIGYKDIERAYENANVVLVLRLLFEKTQEPAAGETDFSGDGTGLPASIKRNYADDKGDAKKMRLYDKMIAIIGTRHQLIAAVEIVGGTAHEAPFLIPLLDEVKERYGRIGTVNYDGAAYSREIIGHIAGMGALPRILPPVTASLKARGCMPRRRMLLDLVEDTQKWLREYHSRSLTEARHSGDKRVFCRPVLRRLRCRRYVEGFSRACRYNIRRLVYIHYLNKVPVRWIARGS